MARTRQAPATPYLGDPALDDLVRMNTALLSELWILRDRVTILEHLLEQAKLIKRLELDEHVPQGALAAELERERTRLVEQVIGAPQREMPSVERLKGLAQS